MAIRVGINGFGRIGRNIMRAALAQGKEIDFVANGLDVRADRMVLQELKDPLMHVLRNCVTHGVETRPERLAKGKPAGSRATGSRSRSRRPGSTRMSPISK